MHCPDLIDNEQPKASFSEIEEIGSYPEPLFSIGKVAKQYNVTLRALRFYESTDLLHPLHRGRTRLYREKDCHRLEMILRGKQLGFSIAEIQSLLQPLKDELTVADIESHLSSEQILTKIRSLEQRRDDLDRAIRDLREKQKKMDDQSPSQSS